MTDIEINERTGSYDAIRHLVYFKYSETLQASPEILKRIHEKNQASQGI